MKQCAHQQSRELENMTNMTNGHAGAFFNEELTGMVISGASYQHGRRKPVTAKQAPLSVPCLVPTKAGSGKS